MSWKSMLLSMFGGKSFHANQVDSLIQRVVDRVEPELWGLVYERIPTSSYAEARGYVWARSALVIDRAINDLCSDLRQLTRASVVAQVRTLLADRVVEQLKIYEAQHNARQAA